MINFENFYCEISGGLCGYNGDCNSCSFYEPEYNLSIQQVMQRENVGKHYKMENEEILLWLSEDSDGYLELLVVEDDYTQIEDDIYLEFIVNNKYKEVQYEC